MGLSNANVNKTSPALISFIICCTLSTCVATMNPIQAAATYYSCICCAIMAGLTVAPQPITGDSAMNAFIFATFLSIVGLLLYLILFGKKAWWVDEDTIAGKTVNDL